MFSNDKESFQEMYVTSTENNNFQSLLLTLEIDHTIHNTSSSIKISEEWKYEISKFLSEFDACLELNTGNIFVIWNKKENQEFLKHIKNFSYNSIEAKKGISTCITKLNEIESKFLLTI